MHYLDNASTTEPSETSLKAASAAALVWGNPSSVHAPGREAASLLEESRKKVKKALGLQKSSDDTVIFTSSGTEANNIAILGCAGSKKRTPGPDGSLGTVIMGEGEHPSVTGPMEKLAGEGYVLKTVPTKNGILDLDALERILAEACSPVVIAAFMLANNETGALYDVKAASSLVKRYHPDANVHCDAVQAFTKTRFTPQSLGADTLSVSAHKIHAPRGAGALYVSSRIIKRRNISPVMPGGGQEYGLRSGTENLISIAAFAAAAEYESGLTDASLEKVSSLRSLLADMLSAKVPDVRIIRPEGDFLPYVTSMILPGVRSETMLNFLSSRDVYVSAGSACSARAAAKKKSPALLSFGIDPDDTDSAIRVSLSGTSTEDDVMAFVSALAEGLSSLQKKR